MELFKGKIFLRAALVVGALVLIASIVSGREKPEPAAPARPAERGAPADTLANLDIEKLKRAAKQDTVTDLLAPRSAPAPSAPAAATPEAGSKVAPAAPAAPPLPFTYLGKMIDGGRTTVFVGRGADHYSAEAGQVIDKTYKVEKITDTAITFVFLPLGTRQVLLVPALN